VALAVVVAVVVAATSLAACSRSGGSDPGRARATTTTTAASASPSGPSSSGAAADQAVEVPLPTDRRRGGSVRVGVWDEADPSAPTLGGAAVRALVLPQLFVARPDGRWSPSLVAPRSDVTGEGATSASFRLRPGAVWSDGSPIGVEDLRRSADARFVSSIDGPAPDGTITLRFTAPLPGWRRLWSGQDAVSAPAPGVWGGPFVVATVTPGLETVLARCDRWWGAPAPFLDEVRLVVVPEATMARQLLAAGELDVVMPLAATVRSDQLAATPGVSVDRAERGGWTVALVMNPDRLSVEQRRALSASIDRPRFVRTLLAGEASVLQGFAPSGEDATWSSVGVAAPDDQGALAPLRGATVDLVGMVEEPMTTLLHRSMQKRVRSATAGSATVELRAAAAPLVEGWLAKGEYDAGVEVDLDPLGGCWMCRWSSVDAGLATAADGGDTGAVASLEARLRDEARVLPLWRPTTVAAWRSAAVDGPKANGYAVSGAWNAWEWSSPAGAPGGD
jgi:ABC-type transport system substrate-binding protein